ncbi:Williams Beuren syndrome DDT (WSD) D TOX E motif [Trypanosoma vivax]|uniref:WHIM2 domain-containing protein n=1 Tax=Trypanosoma vivax (strain Y486) TaxID=1055687 RepID=G0U6J3_TRYVY|nr:Williams Beuren syndrome DDT (WSD) D TOX E motif [Trypanosoma vivax]CCC51497.1 conserved hypothetical protein [Trypanosoma vivax Y486]
MAKIAGDTFESPKKTRSAIPRISLKTCTAFQLYRSEGAVGNAVTFGSLPTDAVLPYKVQAAEMTLLSALEVVEGNESARRTFGPATLHITEKYLTEILSFIPLGGKLSDQSSVAFNYGALRRVLSIYGASDDVMKFVSGLAATNPAAAEVSLREMAAVVDNISTIERRLRQSMKAAGEKIGMFYRATLPTSKGSEAGLGDEENSSTPPASLGSKRKRLSQAREPNSIISLSSACSEACSASQDTMEVISMGPPTKVKKLESANENFPTRKNGGASLSSQKVPHGRLRALTGNEKKAVAILNQIIQLLGHIYAWRYNNLLPIFSHLEERVKQVQGIIDAERASVKAKKENSESLGQSFKDVSLDGVLESIHSAVQIYSTDEVCMHDLDEDLLYPIAHACCTEVNKIEGFLTEPFVGLSKEELVAKEKARKAFLAKREEQRLKALQREKAKEEEIARREKLVARRNEERQRVRASLGELDTSLLVDDSTIKNPVSSAPVCYTELPLESSELYERALFLWAMVTSVPKPLRLSQMPFNCFLKGLLAHDSSDDMIIEEVCTALMDVIVGHTHTSSGHRLGTRGRNWFDTMVEHVAISSGNKKKNVRSRGQELVLDVDDDEEEEEEEREEEEEVLGEEGENGGGESAVGHKKNAVTEQSESRRIAALRLTMERIAGLRTLSSWRNIELIDRVNLLEQLVLEALSTPTVQEESAKLRKSRDDEQQAVDKRMKELRDEADKEVKELLKSFSTSDKRNEENMYAEKRDNLIGKIRRRVNTVLQEFVGQQDGKDIGAYIRSLGMDRYHRIYWRFPFESAVFVQSTSATDINFPALRDVSHLLAKKAGDGVLLLEDDMEDQQLLNGNEKVPQRVWGRVPALYLETFVQGLDRRGKNEASLRRNLEMLQPYLLSLSTPTHGRVTRAMTQGLRYVNKLRQ